ncbi:MAG: discoidin domain-containing protein [Phycisphaerae bacterium]|nr:discoidin domain-containing protein [Phycisphaerae bacterium]
MDKSKMNGFVVWAIAFGLSCCASGAETPVSIVQWGQPGGQTDILTIRIDGDYNIGTTFDATLAASPDDVGYYASPADEGRDPVFYGAGTVARKVEVNDNSDGDYLGMYAYTAPGNTYRGMLVWEVGDFQDPNDIVGFEIEVRNRNTTDLGEIRWLIEKDGSWYISEVAGQFDMSNFFTSISSSASDITWYEFTPFVNGVETIGQAALITVEGATSVGYYWDTINNNTIDNRWVGSVVRYFSLLIPTPPPPPTPPRAAHMAGWAPRIQLPTNINGTETTDMANFNVSDFVDQLEQLNTASYISLNLAHGAVATYYVSSYPELSAAINADMFPTRDLLTEVIDELESRGDYRPIVVYFAADGIREITCPAGAWDNWNNYIASLGYTDHHHAVAELIIAYYSLKYGDQIDGWWFDGVNNISAENQQRYFTAARLGNPDSAVAVPVISGVPLKSTPWCDYSAGHPNSVRDNEPWDPMNLAMVENIEAGPWLDTNGNPVADPYDGVLAHMYIPLQRKWNYGDPFPAIQAIDWTTRVVEVGGMISWSLNRQGSLIEDVNFDTLLKINTAMSLPVSVASGENAPNETVEKAFDGDIYTTWLTLENTGWIAYDYTSTDVKVVTEYRITSGDDGDNRDPKDWQLQGSNDGGLTWDTLDTQANQDFTARHQTKAYPINNNAAYKVYRLNITANNGSVFTELAELELVEKTWADFYDFARFAAWWGDDRCQASSNCMGADLFEDGVVDVLDMQILASQWLNMD